jgi:hypothetical protein
VDNANVNARTAARDPGNVFKRTNNKYAKPFDSGRLAMASMMGGAWEPYGQIVLQMAILDTLLSIEEKLAPEAGPGVMLG